MATRRATLEDFKIYEKTEIRGLNKFWTPAIDASISQGCESPLEWVFGDCH